MNKQEVYEFLDQKGVDYEVDEHEAVMNMEELESVDLKYPGRDAKNLFVRDDKKRNYYLITVLGDKRVDLKKFKEKHGTRRLSFGKPDDLKEKLGLDPGSVSPFGLFNDEEHAVEFFIDRQFTKQGGIIGVHPNENTATVWLRAEDLIELLEEFGTKVRVVSI
ncbi:MAG: prolyl-tRNA synthetase associated domain-containing protein [Peptoniphilus sp.]|nr:prolyl-tRNA synthetase associated domain-containing protein [Peptoniphilus sp.]MDD7363294.1 prolyl-tRNA synthetase associated domain-containing protein [Bacillota bacterium]MDY6045389.1 prolyl-tRNA synthetase associated domain-containing protein [Peptoniphilus sp.]